MNPLGSMAGGLGSLASRFSPGQQIIGILVIAGVTAIGGVMSARYISNRGYSAGADAREEQILDDLNARSLADLKTRLESAAQAEEAARQKIISAQADAERARNRIEELEELQRRLSARIDARERDLAARLSRDRKLLAGLGDEQLVADIRATLARLEAGR